MDDHHRARLHAALERWAVPFDGCLIWTGSAFKTREGVRRYPHVQIARRQYYVRRLLWERDHGPIPEGMAVRNTCGCDCCVAPEHLELGRIGYPSEVRDRPHVPRPEGLAPPERVCLECGRTFSPENGNRRLCSEECRVARARRIDRDRKRRERADERSRRSDP